eukprot:SAG31_NODE_2392_length_5797_cov_6.901369_3_plen_66_part_00
MLVGPAAWRLVIRLTDWHRDHPQSDMWPHSKHRVLNMFVHLFDCPPEGGPTAVVSEEFAHTRYCG